MNLEDTYYDGIAVEMLGGLGNQLFQLSAGLLLSRKLSTNLALIPTVSHRSDTKRVFELGYLESVPTVEVREKATTRNLFIEDPGRGSEEVLKNSPSTTLRGFFQRLDYVESVRSLVASFLMASKDFQAGVALGKQKDFIACHVRRGDYLKPRAREFHGLTTIDYHLDALKSLRQSGMDSPIVVFSESRRVTAQLSLELGEKLELAGQRMSPLKLLGLMSSARAWVISNSSLSWWAAIVGSRADGVVFAPDRWMLARNVDLSALYPSSWKIVENALH